MRLANALNRILSNQMVPGIILISAALLAMIISNSSLSPVYFSIINSKTPVNVLFIVNDVLMTIFFLDIGLEIKHQMITGHLSKPKQIFLPIAAAMGGVIMPALIFICLNRHDILALHGWAIPTATDIAFALGVITLLSGRISLELKILLMAIAVIDDLIAILIIAIFYTTNISILFCILSSLTIAMLCLMNIYNVKKIIHYLMVGALLWFFMFHSGVHVTICGVIVALAIPMSTRQVIHKQLYIWVAYFVLPIFAITNAGISLEGITLSQLYQPVPLGIALGLICGKQLGVFSFAWISVKLKIALLPKEIPWNHLYGMAILCGIGFTMSIFIGNLSYSNMSTAYMAGNKLGVLIGSTFSAISGYLFLRYVSRYNVYLKLK